MARSSNLAALALACASLPCLQAQAQPAGPLVEFRTLATEPALKAAQAALRLCASRGYQVSVAVTDRAGYPLVVLRDRFAGPHTPEVAVDKAYSAITFKMDTLSLARVTQSGQEASGIRHVRRAVAVGGGRAIEAAGSVVGAIGVSGAPGGEADDLCARAGITAINPDLELAQ